MMLLMKIVFACLCLFSAILSAEEAPLLFPSNEGQELIVNNRILAKVNGKTISVIDVMKKMDLFLSRAYPEYASSKTARFQFYTTQWRNTLSQMIDNELMMADAEGIDLKISDGDVRETLQERFGPNVMGNLEKIGVTYEEARQMIHAELVAQRMNWFRIQSKALLSVNPQDIKAAYKEFCQKNPPMDLWKYQVLSLRANEGKDAKAIADVAYEKLLSHTLDLNQLYTELKADPACSVQLSQEYDVTEKSLSASHKEVLTSLSSGSFSPPVRQTSRDGTIVYRIFYLKEHAKKQPLAFEKMSDQLQEELVEKAITRESAIYLPKLRERFGFDAKTMDAAIGADFQPFSLR